MYRTHVSSVDQTEKLLTLLPEGGGGGEKNSDIVGVRLSDRQYTKSGACGNIWLPLSKARLGWHLTSSLQKF